MLVEINLLPEKETKNKSLLLLIILAVVFLIIGSVIIFLLNSAYERQLATLNQQITLTEQLIQKNQEKMASNESAQTTEDLQNAVIWARDYPIKAVPIIQKLIALLPERGFLQDFSYDEMGSISITVQFDTTREAAYYLDSLVYADWVKTAQLHSIDAETGFFDKQIGEEKTEPDPNEMKNEKYVPRYIADYEIELNLPILKAEASSEEKGGEDE